MTYKEIQQIKPHPKTPQAFNNLGFPLASVSSGPVQFARRPGMRLKYSDGKEYLVMANGEQRRIK